MTSLPLPDRHATERLARRLAPRLRAGDVLLLEGPIGAGKTHFARALIKALMPVAEEVPSPTFTLVQVYDGPGFPIWHADLYRLTDPEEAVELGLAEAFETALCLVEWPERLGPCRPPNALTLRLSHAPGDSREVELIADGAGWSERLEGLA
ncbi:tRNA (adenosine(37)-N6)-threonylcarbamoyltransferase complex ATPase subunit type 1 TsaE [Pararhodobacter sp. SW119]|uniref:tRNA (adenosine(37)-N6)-threonylcarbamoyltransferase complex ATPase subunit type 1 TsaE n=1 Tax=Pararhodobacter sp. SW119 TaxID=2780075 RepID=UPI001ADED63F|nr:tRNA (adenosine(37)-N6)-threonylcarbamoyltransferase complex ATPase subunit type 1 TsaE [Pararhodobacter sp. SW119]